MSELDSCVFVLFGTTGDLAKRKLFSAIYNLFKRKHLPKEFRVLGVGRRDWSNKDYQQFVKQSLLEFSRLKSVPPTFLSLFAFQKLEFGSDVLYEDLKQTARKLTKSLNIPSDRLIFYYSVSSSFFGPITKSLKKHGIIAPTHKNSWPRVIFEKPFGSDLPSARKINVLVQEAFAESQTYRIDHYVAKSAIQNLLVFRFGNNIFDALLNRQYVDHIQLTIAESLGVEERAGFYDATGALKDIIQNHGLQVISLLMMEPPSEMTAEAIHNEKAKLLQSLSLPGPVKKCVARGQYAKGKDLVGYKQEKDIPRSSTTETYAAIKLQANNWRWEGVPVYVRSGKRLPKKLSEIVVVFKKPPAILFDDKDNHAANILRIRIQPEEGIAIRFNTKTPSHVFSMESVEMNFCHDCLFGDATPSGYETLVGDAIRGDRTLFTRWDELETSWKLVDPITKQWNRSSTSLEKYSAGTWGPKGASALLERDGREWIM